MTALLRFRDSPDPTVCTPGVDKNKVMHATLRIGDSVFFHVTNLEQDWDVPHGFAMLGAAAFTLSFAVSIMYLIQEWYLKHHKVGFMYYRLPSLEILDEMNYKIISLGFIPLTLGILSGSVWAEYVWGAFWSWDPKQTWSLITWFVYAALLHGRLTIGWRGRKAAIIAIIGFMAVIFTFLGVNLLLGGKHGFQ